MAGFCAAFLIRMVFSALVDADYLDTEAYYTGLKGTPAARGKHPDLAELSRRLEAHLDDLQGNAERRGVNDLRAEVLAHARQGAVERQGMFTLTVPTGGGKTDLDRDAVLQVFDCSFVAEAANVVYVGGVGTGKTHLSIALGMACCQHDYRVRFVTAAELVTLLVEAQQQSRAGGAGARPLPHHEPLLAGDRRRTARTDSG